MSANQSGSEQQYAVLLTVDAQSYSSSTIDLAVDMAAALQSRLHGLFIEDEDLLRVAQLPFTREIAMPTAQERSTDAAMMQRSLRAMAGQFREYLARAAQASRVQWSYDYVRGRTCDIGLKPETSVTYTILGQAISLPSRPARVKRTRRVLLLENCSVHLVSALEVIMRRFAKDEVQITVIKNAEGVESPVTEVLRTRLRELGGATVMEFDRSDLSRVLNETDTEFDYVIVSRDESADSLRDILRKSVCPVILVS